MTPRSQPDIVLNPAVRVLWRGDRSIQLELGSCSVVVKGMPAQTVRAMLSRTPRGAVTADQISSEDPDAQPPRTWFDTGTDPIAPVRQTLYEQGFLWSRSSSEEDPRLVPTAPRLAGELNAMSALRGEQGAELLSGRRHCTVAVQGNGRAGSQVAAILAAAGVGRVYLLDSAEARLAHAQPGGLLPTDEGTPICAAATRAIRRAAPEVDTTALPIHERPDLVIVACDTPIQNDHRDALHRYNWAHLAIQVGPTHAVVGPLVIPSLTSCLRCADLYRLDRDPAWTALAVQLGTPTRYRPGVAAALCATAAGIAAIQALEYLDGGNPAVIDGTLEMHLPDWRVRRRSWPTHPDCNCSS